LQRETMSVYSPIFYSFSFRASFPDFWPLFRHQKILFF
jgi:hypothetical protein